MRRAATKLVVTGIVMLGCSAESNPTPPDTGGTTSEETSSSPIDSSSVTTSGPTGSTIVAPSGPTDVTSVPPVLEWPGPRRARRISSNQYATCVIRPDQTVACWGSPGVSAGDEAYKEVSGAAHFGSDFCGLKTDGTVKCFVGGYTNDFLPKEGTYKHLFVSLRMACAQRLDDTITCWGQPEVPEWLNAPTEPLTRVSAGAGTGCGFAADGSVKCWGWEGAVGGNRLEPGRNDYEALYIGGSACGLLKGGSIECWGLFRNGTVPSRTGYVQIASGLRLVCGVNMDGRVDCAGGIAEEWGSAAKGYPSDKKFEEISVGEDFVCGITTELDVECWGGSTPGTTTVPQGLKAIALEDNPE
jgi:hypothetical protein